MLFRSLLIHCWILFLMEKRCRITSKANRLHPTHTHKSSETLLSTEDSTLLFPKVMPIAIPAISAIFHFFSSLNNAVKFRYVVVSRPHIRKYDMYFLMYYVSDPFYPVYGLILSVFCDTFSLNQCHCISWCVYVLGPVRQLHKNYF